MRKKITILGLVLLLPLLIGCSTINLREITKWDDANAENVRNTAGLVMNHWDMNSEAIKRLMGPGIKELPVTAVEAIAELDKFKKRVDNGQDLTDVECVGVIFDAGVLLTKGVRKILVKYFPEVLKFLATIIK